MDKIGWSGRISVINFVLSFTLFLFFTSQISQAANFSPATVQDLIDDITTANTNNEDDIITLDQPTIYDIMGTETGVPFVGTGNNGLPIILPDDTSGTAHTLIITSDSENNVLITRDSSIADCNGNNRFRIFEVSSGADLTLIRTNIENGCEDLGGGIYNDGTLTLDRSFIDSNVANIDGGGIYNTVNGLVTMTAELFGASFVGTNFASNNGGGVYNAGTLEMPAGQIGGNIANGNDAMNNGGGVYNDGILNIMSISSSIGANSTINGDGGGVYNTQNGSITLSQSQINNNVCDNGNGGGIYNIGMVEFMSGSSASRNRANNGNGGGIFNALDATVTMNPNTFVGLNEANNGGGIYNVGLFNCTNCNIGSTSNTALNDGGGIYNIGNSTLTANINSFPSELTSNIANNNGGGIFNNGMLEITGYKLEGNNVFSFDMDDDEEGGSIFNDLLGVLTIRDSSITFSNADGGGGGVRNLGDFTAINVTISTNTTMGNGGGIKNSGELTLTNVTIANNMASEGGGIWDDSIITVNIKNSLVVGNTATSTGANCQGPIANPIGSNVSDDTSCPFPVQNFDTANMLGPLTGFGGGNSTSLHSLIPFGSNPAIDSILPQDCTDQETPANMITADQRGSIRPVNFNCDSGAFEFLPLISIRIKKIVAPTSDEDFSFTSSGLSDSGLCSVAFSPLTQDDFILRDNLLFGEFLSCFNLPGGAENVYTITEMIPPGQKLNISCRDVVDGLITNNETGMLTFSSLIGGGIECVFINTLINTLVNVEEATLKQCPLGGIVIQTGPDSNINGMLDPEEVVDEFIVCDEEPGPQGPPGDDGEPGPQGPPGDDGEGFNSLTDINIEPAGPNCANGGFRFDVGLDLNRNGILDPEEITDTSYACNGADGTDGTNGSKCALAGGGSDGGLSELIALLVLPLFIVLGRRLRRRGVG